MYTRYTSVCTTLCIVINYRREGSGNTERTFRPPGRRKLMSCDWPATPGEYAYKNELVEFTLAIEKIDREFARMFIGVLADGYPFSSDNSFKGNAGAFGWAGVGQVGQLGRWHRTQHLQTLKLQRHQFGNRGRWGVPVICTAVIVQCNGEAQCTAMHSNWKR